jgi:hypothetical protein
VRAVTDSYDSGNSMRGARILRIILCDAISLCALVLGFNDCVSDAGPSWRSPVMGTIPLLSVKSAVPRMLIIFPATGFSFHLQCATGQTLAEQLALDPIQSVAGESQ